MHTGIEANNNPAWAGTFTAVRTKQLRLVVTQTPDDIFRIWEVELYRPLAKRN